VDFNGSVSSLAFFLPGAGEGVFFE